MITIIVRLAAVPQRKPPYDLKFPAKLESSEKLVPPIPPLPILPRPLPRGLPLVPLPSELLPGPSLLMLPELLPDELPKPPPRPPPNDPPLPPKAPPLVPPPAPPLVPPLPPLPLLILSGNLEGGAMLLDLLEDVVALGTTALGPRRENILA